MITQELTLNLRESLVKREACPICQSNGINREFSFDGFEIAKCPSCDLRFQSVYLCDPKMDEINQTPALRDAFFPECSGYFQIEDRAAYVQSMSARWTKWLSLAEGLIPGRRLIDLGCGTGEFLNFARFRGWDVSGVDYDPSNIRTAKELYQIPGTVCDLTRWPDDGTRYDLITLFDILEHFVNPNEILETCRERLADSGALLIAVPNDRNLLSMLARWFYRGSGRDIVKPVKLMYEFDHRSHFSPRSLEKLLEKNQLKPVKFFMDETNLSRLNLGSLTRAALSITFIAARLLNLQNRVLVLARKEKRGQTPFFKKGGWPIFSDVQSRYDYEWKQFPGLFDLGERAEEEFFSLTSLTPEDLKGKVVCDAGCGAGRHTQIIAKYAKEVTALELSPEGLAKTKEVCSGFNNVKYVLGSVTDMPFENQTFDMVFCLAVLTFIPEPVKGFQELSRVTKNGGIVSVYVLQRKSAWYEALDRFVRKITSRLPNKILHFVSACLVPLVPLMKRVNGTQKRREQEGAGHIFDWLSSETHHSHTPEDVAEWYRSEDFDSLVFSEELLGSTARKKASKTSREGLFSK